MRARPARFAVAAALALALAGDVGCTGVGRIGGIAERQARSAIATVKTARVGKAVTNRDWLQPTSDGAIEVTGYLASGVEQSRLPFGDRYVIGIVVPEQAGAVRVFHLLPVSIARGFKVRVDDRLVDMDDLVGRSGVDDVLTDVPSDADGAAAPVDLLRDRWVKAKLRVKGSKLRADSIEVLDREVMIGAWPSAYPPQASATSFRIPHPKDSSPSAFWLDIEIGSEARIEGMAAFRVVAERPIVDMKGSVDVQVPDRLGQVEIYHLVQLHYVNEDDLTYASDASAFESEKATGALLLIPGRGERVRARFRLAGSKLIADEIVLGPLWEP